MVAAAAVVVVLLVGAVALTREAVVVLLGVAMAVEEEAENQGGKYRKSIIPMHCSSSPWSQCLPAPWSCKH